MIKLEEDFAIHENLMKKMIGQEETLSENGNIGNEECADCIAHEKERKNSKIKVKGSPPIRNSDDTKSLASMSVEKPQDEGASMKRSESAIVLSSSSVLSRSPKKFRKALASLSPKIGSKPKRRVTVNEYPPYPASSETLPLDVSGAKLEFRQGALNVDGLSEFQLKSRSLDNRNRHAKLGPSPSLPIHCTKQDKKRLRSTSLLSKPSGILSVVDSERGEDEVDHASKGRSLPQFLKSLAPNLQRRKSGGQSKMEENINNKTNCDASSENKQNKSKLSGLSLPDDNSLHRISWQEDSHSQDALQLGNDSRTLVANENEQGPSIEAMKQKVIKTNEMITKERVVRDENLAEYMKLVSNADRQQTMRIRSVFEKKDVKSASVIEKLQKKLDGYQKKIKELESSYERSISVLSDIQDESGRQSPMSSNGEGMNGISINVSRDFDGKRPFESKGSGMLSPSLDELSSDLSLFFSTPPGSDAKHPDNSARSSAPGKLSQPIKALSAYLETLRTELQTIRESQQDLRNYFDTQVEEMERSVFRQLDEDTIRREVELNETTESQQKEIAFLKQELRSLEEKMEYHAHEQARDTQEFLERCQNRIAKIEIQQQQAETTETATARALLGKAINLLMSVLALVFVVVSTLAGLVRPFMQTRVHILLSIFAVGFALGIYNYWYAVR